MKEATEEKKPNMPDKLRHWADRLKGHRDGEISEDLEEAANLIESLKAISTAIAHKGLESVAILDSVQHDSEVLREALMRVVLQEGGAYRIKAPEEDDEHGGKTVHLSIQTQPNDDVVVSVEFLQEGHA